MAFRDYIGVAGIASDERRRAIVWGKRCLDILEHRKPFAKGHSLHIACHKPVKLLLCTCKEISNLACG